MHAKATYATRKKLFWEMLSTTGTNSPLPRCTLPTIITVKRDIRPRIPIFESDPRLHALSRIRRGEDEVTHAETPPGAAVSPVAETLL